MGPLAFGARDESTWFGANPSWLLPFESTARRRYGRELHRASDVDTLRYEVNDLKVPGRHDPIPLTVVFQRITSGCLTRSGTRWSLPIPPEDYPRVYADTSAESPHRLPGGALCLYQPFDPPERRWTSDRGLLALIDLARDHVFLETYWRQSGGKRTGVWLTEEAPHGLGAE